MEYVAVGIFVGSFLMKLYESEHECFLLFELMGMLGEFMGDKWFLLNSLCVLIDFFRTKIYRELS